MYTYTYDITPPELTLTSLSQNTSHYFHRGNETWILVEMKLSEVCIEVNDVLHFSTDDVTSYEKVDELTYILNVSSVGRPENDTIVFNLLPDELRDLSNLSNSRTQDFVWIFDDIPPTIDVTCDAFSASKENVVTFTVRNSRHSKQPESIVTLTEENLDYDRERLVLVDLVLLENVSSVYLATFNTSYQLVPFTFSVQEGSVRDTAGHKNVVLPNQTCTQVFDWIAPEPLVVVEPILFGTATVKCDIERSDNVVIEHVAYGPTTSSMSAEESNLISSKLISNNRYSFTFIDMGPSYDLTIIDSSFTQNTWNDVGYEFVGVGSCWTNDHVHPSTHSTSDVGTVTPQACYERCIETYGAGNCAGFDTRANCLIYSFSGDVETNRITTTRNCDVNGGATNCDTWTGGDCYAAIVQYSHEDTSTRRTDMLNMTCFTTSMNGEGTTFWNGFGTLFNHIPENNTFTHILDRYSQCQFMDGYYRG